MITDAKNPRWADVGHTVIILDVLLQGETEHVQFAARPSDCEAHGVRLYYETLYEHRYGDIADSDEERVLRGEMPPPAGKKIADGTIVPMTMRERLDAGQISREDYDAWLTAENETEYDRRVSELNTPENQAVIALDPDSDEAKTVKAAFIALKAVRGQPGWPLAVIWPD